MSKPKSGVSTLWGRIKEWISSFLARPKPPQFKGESYFSSQGTCAVLELARGTPGALKTYRIVPRYATGFDLLMGCDSIANAREEIAALGAQPTADRRSFIPPALRQAFNFKASHASSHAMWAVWIPQSVGYGNSGYSLFFAHISLESPVIHNGDRFCINYLRFLAKKILEIHPMLAPQPDWDDPRLVAVLDGLYKNWSETKPIGDASIRWVAKVSSIPFEKELDRLALKDFGSLHVTFPRHF